MKGLSTQPYKGSRDFYPPEMRVRRHIFQILHQVCQSFGYEEYDGPMLEELALYRAKTGEEIVNEQLYSFTDRGKRDVAMRPEMTPTLARMVAAKAQELPRPIRWYSIPNLWRYEKPQRGRLREHWQLNIDVFGVEGIAADVEIIEVTCAIMDALGAKSRDFKVHLNNRRLSEEMFSALGLSGDTRQQVGKAIDKRAKVGPAAFKEMCAKAGASSEVIDRLEDCLNGDLSNLKSVVGEETEGYQELEATLQACADAGLSDHVLFDCSVMRGFDYYTGNVFEVYDCHPENRRSLFGGGRYDNLVGLFGGNALTGTGIAVGDVTLWDFFEAHQLLPEVPSATQVMVALFGEDTRQASLDAARQLRQAGIKTDTCLSGGKLAKQFKVADKKGIPYVLLIGTEEAEKGLVNLKDLKSGEQTQLSLADVIARLKS